MFITLPSVVTLCFVVTVEPCLFQIIPLETHNLQSAALPSELRQDAVFIVYDDEY
tara:strand:- start:10743 stop:10907 length:165 start_codon:yes stop_codon:yes gene_type:complete